jgi:predicted nuclease with TOPRIM domain
MSEEFDKSTSIIQERDNNSEILENINNFQQEGNNNENFYYKNKDTDNSQLNEENFNNKNKENYITRSKNYEKTNYHTNFNFDVESTLSKLKLKDYCASNTANDVNCGYYNNKLSKIENEYLPKNLKTLSTNLYDNQYEEPEIQLKNRAVTSKNASEYKASYNYNIHSASNNISKQDLNRLTESNNNVNYLPTQSNVYNPNAIQKTSVSNEETNKILMQVMEKDKIIFEYSKLLKETERMLEKNKKLNADKDEQIRKCRDEIKELKFKNRNSENLIKKKDEEFEKYKNYTEEKFLAINKEKALFEEKYNDLAKLFENNHSDFQNTVFEYKKMENNIDRFRQQIQEKEEVIRSNEKLIEELKKEVKQIPNLKKEIIDLENILKNLNRELNEEKNLNDKIIQNTNEAEKKLTLIIEESKQGKELMNNYLRLTFECENVKKEIEFKDKEIETLNERYKSLMKENDYFVQHFTKEITDFNCLMENINYAKNSYSTSNINLNNNNIATGGNAVSEKFPLKYEILNKNFDGLRKRYVENYNQNLMIINKFEKSLNEIERINKEIMNERDKLIKELTITNQNYKDSSTRIEDLNDDNEKMNENYKNLRDNYIKLKSEYEELQNKNENLCLETHLFLMNCNEKLKEKFPEINSSIDRKDILNTNNSINNKTKRTECNNLTNESKNFYHI